MDEIPYRLLRLKFVAPSWEQLLDNIESNHDMSHHLKTDWSDSLTFLRNELGKGFFKQCGCQHPLVHLLSVIDEDGVRQLVEWVNVLKILKSKDSNYAVLMSKLNSPKKAKSEALHFINISKKYLAEGFDVRFSVENGLKCPDIEVFYPLTREQLFIEVSRINDTQQRDRQQRQFYEITEFAQFEGYDLPVAGKLHSMMNEAQLEETKRQIKLCKKQAWETKSLSSYDSEDITIAFCTNDSIEELKSWCKEYGIDQGIQGLSVDFNDTGRVLRHRKIHDEAKQLPKDRPGLLYFPVQLMYMWAMNKADTIIAFEKELEAYPNIIGLVMKAEAVTAKKEPMDIDFGHIYSEKQDANGVVHYTLFIQNPLFNLCISQELKSSIRNAIR
jgi:hypothetical protein